MSRAEEGIRLPGVALPWRRTGQDRIDPSRQLRALSSRASGRRALVRGSQGCFQLFLWNVSYEASQGCTTRYVHVLAFDHRRADVADVAVGAAEDVAGVAADAADADDVAVAASAVAFLRVAGRCWEVVIRR